MKAWLSRGIEYYKVFPSQGPAIFWLSLQKIVEAILWAWMGLRKEHETGGKGLGHNFWKNGIEQGNNINRLKSVGSKITSQIQFSPVQSLSHVRLFVTPWTAARQASLSITNPQSSLKLGSITSVMPSNHLIPFSSHLQSFPASGLFKWVSSLHQVAKVLEFQLQHHPSKEYSRLTSFRMDWLDLLAVQGTLKNLLQHHSSKASILWCSAFFIVHLSHPYMTTGKTKALTLWTFVGKVMSLLLNMLSRLVITFLPRSKHLLISWLQSPWNWRYLM